MAAGLGFKTFNTGDVLSAADVNGYLMQGVLVFASTAARDAAITSPAEGQFAFTKDTNSLFYYDGAAWVASGATGDIEGVTAGTGISGGGTSGTVTITNSMATAIDAKGDLVVGTGADTFSRLAVGANGTTLVADSAEATGLKWATPASAGGMTLLSTTNLSGASISLTSISQSYKELVIYLKDFYSSSATNVPISVNNGTNVASRLFLGGRSPDYEVIDYADTANLNWIAVQSNTQNNNFMEIRFPDYSNTDTMKIVKSYTGFYNTDPYKSLNFAIGLITTTTAISQISIATTAGTWSAGTCELYGVK